MILNVYVGKSNADTAEFNIPVPFVLDKEIEKDGITIIPRVARHGEFERIPDADLWIYQGGQLLFVMPAFLPDSNAGYGMSIHLADASIIDAENSSFLKFMKRPLIIHEWKEPIPGGEVMDWRMEEKENGDLDFTMSCDIRIAIAPLPIGDSSAEAYTYTPIWPVDPNAPVVDDFDEWGEDE